MPPKFCQPFYHGGAIHVSGGSVSWECGVLITHLSGGFAFDGRCTSGLLASKHATKIRPFLRAAFGTAHRFLASAKPQLANLRREKDGDTWT